MTTAVELENLWVFRLLKVTFVIALFIVVGLTLVIWYSSVGTRLDASSAYIVCNHAPEKKFDLSASERIYLETFKHQVFDKGSDAQIRINKLCYADYSNKDPDTASSFDIDLFRQMEQGTDGKIYVISGINEKYDWQLQGLFIALIVEALIFATIRFVGLYILGGKEAL
ncbi:hypothetical protein FJY94_02365 [Candidatus Kaiserbacteria bacterium]|nr:hypothetical protein [Candidatus Kaiserbacteria bacterium]